MLPDGAEDVSGTILFAPRCGFRYTARGGGHCFAGRSFDQGCRRRRPPDSLDLGLQEGSATIGAGSMLSPRSDTRELLDEVVGPDQDEPGVGVPTARVIPGYQAVPRPY